MAKKKQIVLDPTTLPGNLTYAQNNANGTDIPLETPKEENAKEEGKMEATKEAAREEEMNSNKLDSLLDQSTDVLYKLKNIVPLFPSELIISPNKVTIIHRPFFFSERIHSVSIQDISDVYIDTMPFMAMISIVDRDFVDNVLSVHWVNVLSIKWVPKGRAEKARRIITGLMQATKEEIDITKLEGNNLVNKLEEIGKVRQASTTVSKA